MAATTNIPNIFKVYFLILENVNVDWRFPHNGIAGRALN